MSTHVCCDLCGADEYKVLYTPRTTDGPVVQCKVCDLIYVNPRLRNFIFGESGSDQWLGEYQGLVNQFHLISPDQANLSEPTKRQYFQDRLGRIRSVTQSGNLLDVGCATGIFLDMARAQGFRVFGVEPTVYLAAEARTRFGLDLYAGTLEEAALSAMSFDVITLFHVIEHVSSPLSLLKEACRVLKPGGLLYLETPCVDNLWFRIMSSHWRQFIPDHYYFFSKKTLTQIVCRAGFVVMEVANVGKKLTLDMVLARLYRYSHLIGHLGPIIVKRLGLGNVALDINLGDVALVLARRPC